MKFKRKINEKHLLFFDDITTLDFSSQVDIDHRNSLLVKKNGATKSNLGTQWNTGKSFVITSKNKTFLSATCDNRTED